ncbi:hypothetical protein ACTIVE_5529 [Actinomadura verrucosospora]|uniref:Uncharacterized protein n=1 Tax=Actinomadura verrucosospora TaxID=46165 RepID=A0A7D3ZZ59_ACTVE|nr:hypothetical protein ACTIVE_5529 [Actinomadura verrucosospora]
MEGVAAAATTAAPVPASSAARWTVRPPAVRRRTTGGRQFVRADERRTSADRPWTSGDGRRTSADQTLRRRRRHLCRSHSTKRGLRPRDESATTDWDQGGPDRASVGDVEPQAEVSAALDRDPRPPGRQRSPSFVCRAPRTRSDGGRRTADGGRRTSMVESTRPTSAALCIADSGVRPRRSCCESPG